MCTETLYEVIFCWTQCCVWLCTILDWVQFTSFWSWNEMKWCWCPLMQAWPACTLWSWWCRPGSGVYVTRERVRLRRKEKRRLANIWSCEFSLLQSLVEPVHLWSLLFIISLICFCDLLRSSAHYIILLVESVLFGVFVMVIFYDQVSTGKITQMHVFVPRVHCAFSSK